MQRFPSPCRGRALERPDCTSHRRRCSKLQSCLPKGLAPALLRHRLKHERAHCAWQVPHAVIAEAKARVAKRVAGWSPSCSACACCSMPSHHAGAGSSEGRQRWSKAWQSSSAWPAALSCTAAAVDPRVHQTLQFGLYNRSRFPASARTRLSNASASRTMGTRRSDHGRSTGTPQPPDSLPQHAGASSPAAANTPLSKAA